MENAKIQEAWIGNIFLNEVFVLLEFLVMLINFSPPFLELKIEVEFL
jgi:hypothetical protein